MPREVMIQFIGDPALTGQPVGSTALRYGVDADEICKLGLAKIIDEFPPPRSWLLDEQGNFPEGVRSGNQVQQTEEQRQSEQQFLQNQVRALDQKHELEAAERQRKDAIEKAKRETSRG